ncbi:MAG: pyridoxamine 5'-phosphate oxidase family protein [Thermodesulfobacteriota bacterium]
MRRKDRALPEQEAASLLDSAEYGLLSTVAADGRPYGVPLNYCVIERCVYFHCAGEGHKIDNIENNQSVSFCVVGETEVQPDKFATNYESVILAGEVAEVFDHEKQVGLEGLLHKYSPGFLEKGKKYIDAMASKTRVFKITATQLSGKSRKEK